MDDKLWFMPLIVALLLVICGTGIVKNPSMLSNYSSLTDEEKSSPAFRRYLRDIWKVMCVMAAFLILGILFNLWLGLNVFSGLAYSSFLMACDLLHRQSEVSGG